MFIFKLIYQNVKVGDLYYLNELQFEVVIEVAVSFSIKYIQLQLRLKLPVPL